MCPSGAGTPSHDAINCSKGQAWEGPGLGKVHEIRGKSVAFTRAAVKAGPALDVCCPKGGSEVHVPEDQRDICGVLGEGWGDSVICAWQDARLDHHKGHFWS